MGVLISPLSPKCEFFFIGADNCGKSTLCNFIETLIGEDFVSSVALEDFSKSFIFASIYNKKLNICDELKDKYNSKTWSVFKRVTGKGKSTINIKNVPAFSTHLDAKFVFCGNFLPVIPDDKSLIDRIEAIFFDYTVPKEERDPRLPQKLYDERNGIVIWAMKGLIRYINNGYLFTTVDKQSSESITNSVSSNLSPQDSVYKFFEKYISEDSEAITSNHLIYEKYELFCELIQLRPCNKASKKLIKKEIFNKFLRATDTRDKENKRAIKGIKLLEE